MKIQNAVQLKLENFDKCFAQCDTDCPLGALYDFTCALKSFVLDRMKEAEAQAAAEAAKKAQEAQPAAQQV